ncbi:sensor histidine kinase [Actinomadura macrotermitis]|uniref:Sensor histidine kinase n=1 Tax=Actinomadura macrotermitis TaxID=2585200 RepID=A0A7K0C081_9ACTN|nr:sensor histidine kinase [Actinomadura macrotermitis]MQY06736.1 hypothetical protein [Actinomadura macrotermitis]
MGSLEHRAFLYDGTEDFLTGAVPFLRRGLEEDRAVVVVARAVNVAVLQEALDDCRNHIEFYQSEKFYEHPVRTLNQYQYLVQEKSPRRVFALAEPVWHGHEPRQLMEWIRYESLINEVFGDSGASALCPYDRVGLPPAIVEEARRTHPLLLTAGAARRSDRYVPPKAFGAGCDRGLRFDRPPTAEYLPLESDDLHELRAFVGERALAHGLDALAAGNLMTAVNEIAANALQHGTPPMGVWVWPDGDELLCEIGDHGFWRPESGALTGFLPPETALQRGFGLWTVRLLVDLLELRPGWDGTFVRLHVRRNARPGSHGDRKL